MPGWVCYLAWKGMNPATRPRFVTTVHGFYSVSPYSAVMLKGERVIAVSDSIAEYIRKNYPRTDSTRVCVIYRGIDLSFYSPEFQPDALWRTQWFTTFPQLENKRLIVLPGRVSRLKGHHDFIGLVARLRAVMPEVHGLIVGDVDPAHQDYYRELQSEISGKGLGGNITFIGHRSDLREIFSMSSLVVSLSSQAESFGRTVLEALAVGTPVVAYARGGTGEILDSLFPQGKVEVNASALLSRCTQVLEASIKPSPVPEKFTLHRMLDNTMKLYLELFGQ